MASVKGLVTYHVNTLKHDIRELHLSEIEVNKELGRSHSYISQTLARRQIDWTFIRDFCDKYFPDNPDQWKRYVVVDEHRKYEEHLKNILTVRKKQSQNTVKPDFEKIESYAENMRLSMTSICKIFGYGESYFSCAKTRNLIAYEFVEKFAELTSKDVSEFIIPEPKPKPEPEKAKMPEIDLSEIVTKLEDIDAAVVGVMKLLQSNNAKFDVLIGEVKKHYD